MAAQNQAAPAVAFFSTEKNAEALGIQSQSATDIASILRNCSTEEAAAILKIRPQTLRAAVCRSGHYFGVRPVKRANRFLAWPAEQIIALANGGEAQ